MRRLPPRPLLGDLVRTTLWIWVGLHVAFAIGAETLGALSPWIAAILLAVVVVVSQVDRTARGLDLFLANLGFSPRELCLLVLIVAGVAEAVLQAAARLLP